MEALAQTIRKWRLIERTSKIDLCGYTRLYPHPFALCHALTLQQSICAACVIVIHGTCIANPNNNNS